MRGAVPLLPLHIYKCSMLRHRLILHYQFWCRFQKKNWLKQGASSDGIHPDVPQFTDKLQFTIPNQQNSQLVPYIYLYYITLKISTCFDPQGTIIRKSKRNKRAWNQISHFSAQLTWWRRVKWLKYGHFFVGQLYKRLWNKSVQPVCLVSWISYR
jgi:hypothetical protein